jgi:hypothetical protein
VPSYVIRHRHPPPDEVQADSYVEQDGFLIFLQDGKEILRLPVADVVSVGPKRET